MFLSNDTREKALLELEKKKLESLRRQAQALKALRDRTHEVEEERKKREDEIMGRLTGSLLKREINDWFGPEAKNAALNNYSLPKTLPPPATYIRPKAKPRLLNDVLTKRRQEHEQKQAEIQDSMKMLNTEKQRIIHERERLIEQKRELLNPSPYSVLEPFHFPSRPPSQRTDSSLSEKSMWLPSGRYLESVHSDRSMIQHARQNLPIMQSQLRRMRDDYERERHLVLNTPYMGENGINSYEPWQYEDYYLMREFVLELVDQVLDNYSHDKIRAADYETEKKIAREEESDLVTFKKYHGKERAVQLIVEELLLQMTGKMTRDTVLEYLTLQRMAKKMADHLTINTAEHVATDDPQGRPEDDPAYNMITKTHRTYCKERTNKRKELWRHTLPIHTLAPREPPAPPPPVQQQQPKPKSQQQQTTPPPPPPPQEEKSFDESDVKVLQFHDIIPYDLRSEAAFSTTYRLYKDRESRYWEEIYPAPSDIKVGKKTKGIESAAVAPNHRLLAMGTAHGDILVYDLWYNPPKAIRLINNESPESDAVVFITWSLDNSQIISINESKTLLVWSMVPAGISQKDVKDLEIKHEKDGVLPSQLKIVVVMDADKYDFNFQQGPLAESGSQSAVYGPLMADFHPSITLLGSQRHIAIGLENGDVIKCDIERGIVDTPKGEFFSTPKVFQDMVDTDQPPNLIGQELPAELFRGHKGQLIYIGFIKNNGHMITVDNQGYIFVWKYNKKSLSHFGWFEPYKKYRLELTEKTYIPTPNIGPKVFFKDTPPSRTSKKSSKSRRPEGVSDPAMETRRGEAEEKIAGYKFDTQIPWHKEYDPVTKLETYLYAPLIVSKSGALIHIIQREATTGKLVLYSTSHYSPAKNKVSRLLSCKQSPDGQELVFMLLFPHHDPKGPHITFVSVDLMKVKMTDMNILIELTPEQFQRCLDNDVCSFDITRLHDATASDYIICNISGSLMAYSLNTGSLVMTSEVKDKFVGLKLDTRVIPNAKILATSTGGQLSIIQCPKTFTSDRPTLVPVTYLLDKNSSKTRKTMWKTFNTWDGHDLKAPIDQMSRRHLWTLDGDPDRHTVLYLRQLVLEMVDDAIQKVDGAYSPADREEYAKQDRIQPFQTAEQVQEESEAGSIYLPPSRPASLLSQNPGPNSVQPSRAASQRSLQNTARGGANPPVP